jgi:hypothetical protein
LAAETIDFSKKAIEANSAYVEWMLVAQTTRMSELCTSLTKDSFKPIEEAFTRFQATARAKAPASK